jgi:hypothetical protein
MVPLSAGWAKVPIAFLSSGVYLATLLRAAVPVEAITIIKQ